MSGIGTRGGIGGGILAEKVEILWGDRGNPRQHALRKGELVDVQRIIEDTRKSLVDLRKSLELVKDDIDALNAAVDGIELELVGVQDRIDEAESALTALEGTIAVIDGRLTSIDTNILGLQTEVSHLQADVTALQGSVSGVTTDLAFLTSTVTSLQGDVTAIQGDISELTSQLGDLQVDVNAIASDVDALQDDALSRYAVQSNPGDNPFDPGFEAIPLYTNGELTGGITLTDSKIFTVPVAGVYLFEVEVSFNGGATDHPPIGTPFAISTDTTTVPTVPRPGFSVSDVVRAMTITRLVCTERLAAGAQRVAYILNQGVVAYQAASAVVKITRLSA